MNKMNIAFILVSAILQVGLFTAIPFVWWLVTARKHQPFLRWLGWKRPVIEDKKRFYLQLLGIILLFTPVMLFLYVFVDSSDAAVSQFSGHGVSALVPVLIYSFIQTGLSEEIVFRGFLCKRLSAKTGFFAGNIIQASLFGLMHGALFYSSVSLYAAIALAIATGGMGWFMGWINEKKAGGSILPSWFIHGFANLASSFAAMVNII
ncbi:CPBP family intramembrane glutamic endopeptidase [Paenibacillus dendritiformis]|uniref:CPBP family intramembrane glutamic endopeptidase n=1 Tax=Paenibacillus dendritiformis TaxID=130049 RepID=UPI00387E198D